MSRNILKITAALLLVIFICLFYFVYKGQALAPESNTVTTGNNYEIKAISIGQNAITAEIADTDDKRMLGLGDRSSMPEDHGMLFIFNSPGNYGFWMKDTLIPLDIIWIDANKDIVDLKESILPASFPQVYYPAKPSLYVLELNAGYAQNHQIKIGDSVNF